MKLHSITEYIKLLEKTDMVTEFHIVKGQEDNNVTSITYNTNSVYDGSLFICKGARFKPEYALQAKCKGAVLFVAEKNFGFDEASYVIVKDIRLAMPVISDFHYNHPQDKLYKIGLTGTKGKSTTSYFIKSILDCYSSTHGKKPCGLISSIENYDGKEISDSQLSTPESPEIFRYMNNAVDSGIDHMVIEASSQGLKYNRLDSIIFDAALLLNVGNDHISPIEHPDFEDYYSSKLKIFDNCRTAFVNVGDEHINRTLDYIGTKTETITFGLKEEADYYGYYIRQEKGLLSFYVKCKDFNREFQISMKGLFNVENALAAIAVASHMGISPAIIARGLLVAKVRGRMEHFASLDESINIIVDYAHNKLSFEKLFESVKAEYPDKDIVAVFGCPGNKAYNRREDLPLVADCFCSHVFITEDDPGDESPEDIAWQIASNLSTCPYTVIHERGDAITEALDRFANSAVIVVAGKGDERAQKKMRASVPYKGDKYYVNKWLDEYNKTHQAVIQ